MKKLLLIAPIALVSQLSYAATMQLGGVSSGNTTQTMKAHANQYYYKCSNSVTISCSGYAGIQLTYTGQSGGSGTSLSPYVLTGCSNIICMCDRNSYKSSSGCKECENDLWATPDTSTLHTNTSCEYCATDKLKISKSVAPGVYITACDTCPSNATCDGTTTFKCNVGYYGTATCERCPYDMNFMDVNSHGPTFGTTASIGKTAITDCYIPSGNEYYDNTGNFKLTSNCSYTN